MATCCKLTPWPIVTISVFKDFGISAQLPDHLNSRKSRFQVVFFTCP